MPKYTTEAICNVALLGGAGAGKTALTEALLQQAGVIHAPGHSDKGTTVSDPDPPESFQGHSVDSSIVHLDHGGRHINLIDTPGYPDFAGRSLSALAAVETAAVVINAQIGIERTAERAMEEAGRRGLCRLVVVSHIDGAHDLPGLLERIQEAFGRECLPINLPAGDGVVDCFFNPSGEADFLGVEAAHSALVDQVVEVDEALMALYLEQGGIEPEQLHEPFEQALREGHLIPMYFVSAATGAGVPELLDILGRLMPNPLEGNPLPFLGADDSEIHPRPDPDAHLLVHVFKTYNDPFIGGVGVFRVAQGTLRPEQSVLVGDRRKPAKLARIHKLQGGELTEVDAAIPGDIGAVTKVEGLHYDAVLHDSHDEDLIRMRPPALPAPMYSLAVEPKHHSDEQKLSEALHKLEVEDPYFIVERSTATRETVIRGFGERHLRAMLERMREHYNVEVETRPPKVAYRETITRTAEGHCRHKKQTGGAGQFGEVYLRIEPLKRGQGFEFVSEVVGGAIPSSLIPAVEKGVQEVLASGVMSGHPVHDVRVTVHDGKHHSVDSKEVAFAIAGRKAFLDAFGKAKLILLEPIAHVEVTAPEPNMGTITGDLSSKRGRISDTRTLANGMVTVSAEVPLAELDQYEFEVKSLTGGQGTYTMEPTHYETVPAYIQKQIVAEHEAGSGNTG